MRKYANPVSVIALGAAFTVLPVNHHAQAASQTKERLEFLKDQTGCRSDIVSFCTGVKAGGGHNLNNPCAPIFKVLTFQADVCCWG